MKEQQTYPISIGEKELREQFEKETGCNYPIAHDKYSMWLESKLRDMMPCPDKDVEGFLNRLAIEKGYPSFPSFVENEMSLEVFDLVCNAMEEYANQCPDKGMAWEGWKGAIISFIGNNNNGHIENVERDNFEEWHTKNYKS